MNLVRTHLLFERDANRRELERELHANPGNQEARQALIRAHDREGNPDAADQIRYQPELQNLGKLSARADRRRQVAKARFARVYPNWRPGEGGEHAEGPEAEKLFKSQGRSRIAARKRTRTQTALRQAVNNPEDQQADGDGRFDRLISKGMRRSYFAPNERGARAHQRTLAQNTPGVSLVRDRPNWVSFSSHDHYGGDWRAIKDKFEKLLKQHGHLDDYELVEHPNKGGFYMLQKKQDGPKS